ncbi:MarR family winged helix-turn-helix transcriptional regulator [Paractinoplanes hotanensis]|uniref:MarR family transcriptional regulator n=1 Tax=Paractinoplanes hotanensis TaxID=2906497 RepID=A0ABT0YGC8_9ACTN|nr:MarR family transcriptional regulator [Actinoplanes hotanensis]MCM4085119.1 MarR family transcriptional regulator [Actinoplanes hotanensis]
MMREDTSGVVDVAAPASAAPGIAGADDGPGRLDHLAQMCRTANFARRYLEVSVLADANLTWTSYDVLHLTVMHRPVDTGVVAALAHVSKGSVTRSAAALIKRGLLRRSIPTRDRRRSLLAPTAAGWALNQQLRAQLIAALNTLLDGQSDADRHDIAVLRHLITAHQQ